MLGNEWFFSLIERIPSTINTLISVLGGHSKTLLCSALIANMQAVQ